MKLSEVAGEETVSIDSEAKAIRQKLDAAQEAELAKNKDLIIRLIEKEIAGRYYYQRGKVQIGLRNDPEVNEAISILNDDKRYNEILGN